MEEAQEKLEKAKSERETTEQEIHKKDEEIKQYQQQLKEHQSNFEKVQLKLLTYRKEDIMDLISCLKNSSHNLNTLKESEVKHKLESLGVELLKIDTELFELEKKYGEFRKHSSIEMQPEEDESLEDQQQVLPTDDQIPVIEKSSLSESKPQEETPVEEMVEEIKPKLSKAQI